MNKKRTFVMLLLVGLLISGLFGPPTRGVSADDTIYTYIEIVWGGYPHAAMCVGDTAPIVFQYKFVSNKITPYGRTPLANNPNEPNPPSISMIFIHATGNGTGTLTPTKWQTTTLGFNNLGILQGSYKAEKEGDDQWVITSSVDVVNGASGTFEVVKCDWDIRIGATEYVSAPTTEIDTTLYGKGGFSTSTGVVSGEGDYRLDFRIVFTPPDPGIQCDKLLKSLNKESFVVFGTASDEVITLEIRFNPIKVAAANAKCVDKYGKKTEKEVFKTFTVDPTSEINMGKMSFSPKGSEERKFTFNFGPGWCIVYVNKRKAK